VSARPRPPKGGTTNKDRLKAGLQTTSNGGDIGCRYTPEMMEVLEKALELRKKGIIKF
jgi:hypothetical protein